MSEEDLIRRIKAVEDCHKDCMQSGMRQICIEKSLSLISEKMNDNYRYISLENKQMMTELKADFKEMLQKSMNEIEKKIEDRGKDKTRWGVELIKLLLYFLMFLISMGIVSKLPL